MRPWLRGIIVASLHVGLVASLGAKLLYDRATLPRGWAQAVPYDPNMPIRGRYVSLQLAVEPRGMSQEKTGPGEQPPQRVELSVANGFVVADQAPKESGYDPSAPHLHFINRQGKMLAVLDRPVPFFIPELIPDPSRRPPGEELWVEVTLPRKGPPRPIRLGVSKEHGPIVPLGLW